MRGSDNPWLEIPVYESYVSDIEALGGIIRQRSRWFNAVSISTENSAVLDLIRQLDCVEKILPVARAPRLEPMPKNQILAKTTTLDYGETITQNEILNLPALHSGGWTGQDIRIGVFDTGFILNHPVFSQMDVIAGYDFVDNEANLDGVNSGHGTACVGLIGGYMPGEFIGAAYNASFLLARTEDDSCEVRAEEDNWVAALEWADALGVDVISSSLAYKDFDNANDNYPTSALDGNTTVITQATNLAAERGILVVNAMGNEGSGTSSLWAPADGAHVLSVGGVDGFRHIVGSSGRGPTADGRIKPDVVALGIDVYLPYQSGGYYRGIGTSYATPMIAGSAALVLQANPELSPDSVIALFHQAGDRWTAPDNSYGWGVPDVEAIINTIVPPVSSNPKTVVGPNPFRAGSMTVILAKPQAPLLKSYHIYNLLGQQITSGIPNVIDTDTFTLDHLPDMACGLYFIMAETDTEVFTAKFIFLP